MTKLQPVRGTHDILPEEARKRRYIEQTLSRVAECYGYGEISTPMFEFSEVFHRTLGDTSDVVTKETYTFEDRGGESLTLRPEFTAGVVRAFLSAALTQDLPQKFFYSGPAFRYERPQKGRLRQFHQFGAELLGVAEPLGDVEMIAMAAQMFGQLQANGMVKLELNSLGDADSRNAYRAALVQYFNDHRVALSEDSKTRLDKNPLRILDSKDEGDRKIIAGAPNAGDYFTAHSTEFFAYVKEAITKLGIAYTLNPRLVRGLDYYQHTVFEFTTDRLGAQGTVLAGGRYDGLVALMGGPDIPGVGFAAGIERLLALLEAANFAFPSKKKLIGVIPVAESQTLDALQLAGDLRGNGLAVELITRGGNMGKKMSRADKLGTTHTIVLGESELKTGQMKIKNMADGSEQAVSLKEIAATLKNL